MEIKQKYEKPTIQLRSLLIRSRLLTLVEEIRRCRCHLLLILQWKAAHPAQERVQGKVDRIGGVALDEELHHICHLDGLGGDLDLAIVNFMVWGDHNSLLVCDEVFPVTDRQTERESHGIHPYKQKKKVYVKTGAQPRFLLIPVVPQAPDHCLHPLLHSLWTWL